jgi:predicted secreted protein
MGRSATLKVGGEHIVAGLRAKNVTFGGVAPDVTSDDDEGWQTFLAVADVKGYTIAAEGILKDEAFLEEAALNGVQLVEDVEFFWPGIGTLSSDVIIEGVSVTTNTPEPAAFSATIKSTGPVAFEAVASAT